MAEDRKLEEEELARRDRRRRDNEAERRAWGKRRNAKRPGPFPGRAAVERFEKGQR